MGIDEAFGEGFESKQKQYSRQPQVVVEGRLKQSIIRTAIERITPESPAFQYVGDNANHYIHLVLAKTPKNINPRPAKYGGALVSFLWGKALNLWVSCFVSEEQARALIGDTYYLLVGDMRTVPDKRNPSKIYNNMKIYSIITTDEIAEERVKMLREAEQGKEKEIKRD